MNTKLTHLFCVRHCCSVEQGSAYCLRPLPLLLLLCLLVPGLSYAQQPGSLDAGFDPGTGASSGVEVLAVQPDGKVLIGGGFEFYNGTARNRIARLNADGSLDTSFNPGAGADDAISALALQPDGKVLIGGGFGFYNGTARNRIARLNADGSLDTGFDPGSGANDWVFSFVLQPDGKVLIGGWFTSYDGASRSGIARLNVDGGLDADFNPGTGISNADDVLALALQPDGKVLIGGNFTTYNGTARNRIARLNTDGSLDVAFNPGVGADDIVRSFALQPDGKVLIGGDFESYNGTARNRIARLNADGGLDGNFNPGTGANNIVSNLALQPDGKVLIGGIFTSYNGSSRGRVARVLGVCVLAVSPTITQSGNILSSSEATGNQWLNASQQPIAGATGQTYTPPASGTYYVRYINATSGCIATSLAFSFVLTSRTASLAAGGIQLYPNPSSGTLNVAIATPGSYSLQLADLQGRVVYTTTLSGSASGTTTSLQLPSLPAGLYSVQIAGARGIYSGKLSVQ